jgi:hypothetical protein
MLSVPSNGTLLANTSRDGRARVGVHGKGRLGNGVGFYELPQLVTR